MATANDYGLNYANYLKITYSAGTGFTTLVKTGVGKLAGIMVCTAASTPTLTVYDGINTSGTVIIPTFTPVAGTMYKFGAPILFETGLYLYSGGSVVGTVAYY